MEIIQIYAISVGSVFLFLLLISPRSYVKLLITAVSLPTYRHLIYPRIIRRYRYVGPWSRASVLLQLCYILVNTFCISFNVPNVLTAGSRAAHLSLINMVPNFAGPHLSFLADILGVPLSTYQSIHRSSGIMSSLLLLFHIITIPGSQKQFPLQLAENLWGLVGASSLLLLSLLSIPLLRRYSYEIFIRTHQVLAIFSVYSVRRHLERKPLVLQIYVYIYIATFFAALLLQGFFIRRCQARIARFEDTIKVELALSRPLKVKAGQYINLWIPSTSFWSIFQSHPFTVASWSNGEQEVLELFIEPRGGMTKKLLQGLAPNSDNLYPGIDGSLPRLALFSGPHGVSAPVGDYETVLLVASGSGIVAQLPYLKQLIYGHNAHKSRTRRVHLIWQLESIGTGIAVQSMINQILENDTFRILSISMYIKSGGTQLVTVVRKESTAPRRMKLANGDTQLGTILEEEETVVPSKLVNVKDGSADLETILREEREGKYINRLPGEVEEGSDILITVSGADELRDELRDLVLPYIFDRVKLIELEYQPA